MRYREVSYSVALVAIFSISNIVDLLADPNRDYLDSLELAPDDIPNSMYQRGFKTGYMEGLHWPVRTDYPEMITYVSFMSPSWDGEQNHTHEYHSNTLLSKTRFEKLS